MCQWNAPAGTSKGGHGVAGSSDSLMSSVTVGECEWEQPVFNTNVFVIISLLVVLLSGPIYALLSVAFSLVLAPTPSDIDDAEKDLAGKRKAAHEHHRAVAMKTTREIKELGTEGTKSLDAAVDKKALQDVTAESEEKSEKEDEEDKEEKAVVRLFSRKTQIKNDLQLQFQRAQSFKTSMRQSGLGLLDAEAEAQRSNHFSVCSNLIADIKEHERTLARSREQQHFRKHWPMLDASLSTDKCAIQEDHLSTELSAVVVEASRCIEKLRNEPKVSVGVQVEPLSYAIVAMFLIHPFHFFFSPILSLCE